MGYERLKKSLIDLVKEEQAKLGYRKEMIRLYYPLSSLNHFMETNADSEEMQELLADFPRAAEDIFGEVGITHVKDRSSIPGTSRSLTASHALFPAMIYSFFPNRAISFPHSSRRCSSCLYLPAPNLIAGSKITFSIFCTSCFTV